MQLSSQNTFNFTFSYSKKKKTNTNNKVHVTLISTLYIWF